LKLRYDIQIDFLLPVHVYIVIGAEDIVDEFEVEAEIPKAGEMPPVEAHIAPGFDNVLYHTRNTRQLPVRGLVHQAELEHHPALFHPLVIVHPRVGQISIGANELLTVQCPEAGGFNADILDGSHLFLYDDKVPDLKRPVEEDDEVAEQVAEYGLGG